MLTVKKCLLSLIFCFLISVNSANVETKKPQSLPNAIRSQVKNVTMNSANVETKKPQSLPNAIRSQVKNVTAPHIMNKTCGVENKCVVNGTTVPLCLYDADKGCIRKYASKCHLDIAACKAGKTLNDYNNDYCFMESFICEEGYERWTIFFGYEKA